MNKHAEIIEISTLKELNALLFRAEEENWTTLVLLGPSTPQFQLDSKTKHSIGEIFHLTLNVGDTAAKIAKLANLTSLDLYSNSIGDAGAREIAKLANLTSLNLNSNSIGDAGAREIAKLANLTSLDLYSNSIGDAGAREIAKLANLNYLGIAENPLSHPFPALLEPGQPEATNNVLRYLRGEMSDLELQALVDKSEVDEKEEKNERNLPSLDELPVADNKGLIISSPLDGPLKPVRDATLEKPDEEQAAIYKELRRQLEQVIEDTPSQELRDLQPLINDFLAQPQNWQDVKFRKILWVHGNALRSRMNRHDVVANDDDYHWDKLSPSLSETMRKPIETWNVFVISDPVLREADKQRLGPQEFDTTKQQLESGSPVMQQAMENRKVTSEELAGMLKIIIDTVAASTNDIHAQQVMTVGNETQKDIGAALLRGGYRTVLKLESDSGKEAREAISGIKSGAYGAVGGAQVGAGSMAAAAVPDTIANGMAYVEFIASNPEIMKEYLSIAFSNPHLAAVVDHIVAFYNRLKIEIANKTRM